MFVKIYFLALKVRDALLKKWWNFLGRLLLQANGVIVESFPVLYGLPMITCHPSSKILLGRKVVMCSDSRFTALGVSRPVILRTIKSDARISIGSNTGLSGVVICAMTSIEIGSECLLGADVQIFDNDFHKIEAENRRFDNTPGKIKCAPVVIEDNVFIGVGSIVMKGVRIGCNSVIGAGSIVNKDIPSNSIAAGNPAKVIGQLPV